MVKDKTNKSVVACLVIIIIALCMVLVLALKDSRDTEMAINSLRTSEETQLLSNSVERDEVIDETEDGKIEINNYPEDSAFDFSDSKWKKTAGKFFITNDEKGKTVIEDEDEKVVVTLDVVIDNIESAYCKKWTNTLTVETKTKNVDFDLEKMTSNVYEVK